MQRKLRQLTGSNSLRDYSTGFKFRFVSLWLVNDMYICSKMLLRPTLDASIRGLYHSTLIWSFFSLGLHHSTDVKLLLSSTKLEKNFWGAYFTRFGIYRHILSECQDFGAQFICFSLENLRPSFLENLYA